MTPITTYKSKIASRYIPVAPEHIGLKIMESEYYLASLKHDGHLVFVSVTKDGARLFDATGDELKVPAIVKAAAAIDAPAIFAGELCCFVNDKPTSHREVSAALDEPSKHDLRLGVFDIIEHADLPEQATPADKLSLLKKLPANGAVFSIAQTHYESRKDLIAYFNNLGPDDEGMVVRAANGMVYKVKRSITLDLVVLGYSLSTDDHARMRDLLLGFALDDNRFQVVAKCGNGFSDEERAQWVKQLEGDTVSSDYVEVSGAKTAFIMVKPSHVVELSCLDLIADTTDGPIRKAVLNYDAKQGYRSEGTAPTLSLISPVFVRARADKKVSSTDAGTAQAYHLKPPAQKASDFSAEQSTIVHREAFTKVTKGATAVRKFVALKTNKEQSGVYAPFVVVYSDYSGGRKTPLEQEVFLCASERDAIEKVNELKEENIKKGWEAHA